MRLQAALGLIPLVDPVDHPQQRKSRRARADRSFALTRPLHVGHEAFDKELPWFKYVPTVSRPWDHSDWSGEIGRADDILRKYADHWELDATNTVAYICGHPEMIEHSKAILKRRGFTEKGSVKEEVYWIPAKS